MTRQPVCDLAGRRLAIRRQGNIASSGMTPRKAPFGFAMPDKVDLRKRTAHLHALSLALAALSQDQNVTFSNGARVASNSFSFASFRAM